MSHLRTSPKWQIGLLVADEDQDRSSGDLMLVVALPRQVPVVSLGDPSQAITGFWGGVSIVDLSTARTAVLCGNGRSRRRQIAGTRAVSRRGHAPFGNGWLPWPTTSSPDGLTSVVPTNAVGH